MHAYGRDIVIGKLKRSSGQLITLSSSRSLYTRVGLFCVTISTILYNADLYGVYQNVQQFCNEGLKCSCSYYSLLYGQNKTV
jgi:hypothetical protein